MNSAAAKILVCGAILLKANAAWAQDSSLFHLGVPANDRQGLQLSDSSWLYQRVDPPATVKLHDLITITVKEGSALNSQGQVDRRKTGTYDFQLKNWIKLDGLSIKAAPQNGGQPTANATLDQEYQADTQLQTKDSLTFSIAAEIVDIRPNGNLVLEAHRHIRINEDVWEQSLTGIIRREDILPNNIVLSQNIAELTIDKREVGHVRDGYKRGWLTRFYDRFSIF
jgi:flagellar L-ring protein precursor FlgH